MENKYTSFELMEIFNIKKGSWYNLRKKLNLDNYAEKVIDNNKTKFLYNEDAYNILRNKFDFDNEKQNSTKNDIAIFQSQIIDMYKQRIEYLETENKRLLDLIALKEQKEIAQEVKCIDTSNNNSRSSFWDKLFNNFKK